MKKLIEKLNDFITMCNASWGEIFIDHYGDCYIRLETCMDRRRFYKKIDATARRGRMKIWQEKRKEYRDATYVTVELTCWDVILLVGAFIVTVLAVAFGIFKV